MASRFETIADRQGEQIKDLREDVKTVAKIMTDLAVQSVRLDTVDQHIAAINSVIGDLRKGEGFIYPLKFPKSE